MSIQQRTYVIYGYNVPTSLVNYEDIEDYCECNHSDEIKGDVSVIYDGMCGDYVLVGKVLIKSDSYNEISLNEIMIEDKDYIETKAKIDNLMTELNLVVENYRAKLYIVTHVT